jgi:ribose 5-phosphate isomerase A
MVVGLGSGTTALAAVRALAARLARGEIHDVATVASSRATAVEAQRCGLVLTPLSAHEHLDVTVDGADEVDARLRLLKGGGGAVLREKMVAQASRRLVIAVDERKLVGRLGETCALPLVVVPFEWETHAELLAQLGAKTVLLRRLGTGEPFTTDDGLFVLDAAFGAIAEPEALAQALETRAGIVAHGLYLAPAHEVVVAGPSEGGVRRLTVRH